MATFDRSYPVEIAEVFPKFRYAKSFGRIQAFLDSEEEVRSQLVELDQRVVLQCARFRVEDPDYPEAQALYDILRESEDVAGFNKGEVKYVTRVLAPGMFLSMMLGAYAFLDPFVTTKHGAETHRIHWWMIAQDMRANPLAYDEKLQPADLFRATADPAAYAGPENNVWYHTLDAFQGKCTTARAPESLKEYILTNFPALAAAEQQQMKWDTCVKWRYDTIRGRPLAVRGWEKYQELKRFGE